MFNPICKTQFLRRHAQRKKMLCVFNDLGDAKHCVWCIAFKGSSTPPETSQNHGVFFPFCAIRERSHDPSRMREGPER